jgi:hypothetical protein
MMNHQWIQTYSGRKFFPLAPRAEDVLIEDIAHALANTCRFSGHCRFFYSVAEHSCRVAQAAISPSHDQVPECLRVALLHDAAEAYLMDIPRPIKSAVMVKCGKDMLSFREVERRLLACIFERFGITPDASIEAAVKYADDVLLATEARDIMSDPPESWAPLPPPLPGWIKPQSPHNAEAQFMFAAAMYGLTGDNTIPSVCSAATA